MLGLIDLGADIGERRFGIEAGFELDGHVAAALECDGAHLLDVCHRLELRLDGAQQQPLRIFGADSALRQVDLDDRDLDVRFGLLGNGEIRDESRAQEKDQRGDGELRVTDGVVDKGRHVRCSQIAFG